MQQSYPAMSAQALFIESVHGHLSVRGQEQSDIIISSPGRFEVRHIEEKATLVISSSEKSLDIVVPYELALTVHNVEGDLFCEEIRQAEAYRVHGDLICKKLSQQLTIGHVEGELDLQTIPQVRVTRHIEGDASCVMIEQLELTAVQKDLEIVDVQAVQFGSVGANFVAKNIKKVSGGTVGNNCLIEGDGETEISLGNIGNNMEIERAIKLQTHNIGNNCLIRNCAQAEIQLQNIGNRIEVAGASSIRLHKVGSTCRFYDVAGDVLVNHVGGKALCVGVGGRAQFKHVGGNLGLKSVQKGCVAENVGGHIDLLSDFVPESQSRLHAGGNVFLTVSEQSNITLRAAVGGRIKGVENARNQQVEAVFGNGSALLEIKAGGNLFVRRSSDPGMQGSEGDWPWQSFEHEWRNWSEDWSRQWQQMSKQWQRMGEDFAAKVIEKQLRKAEKMRYRAEEEDRRFKQKEEQFQQKQEQFRQKQEHAARLNVRFQNREWRMDPQRIDHIVGQAKKAAEEGVFGAMDAVERALLNLQIAIPPVAPPFAVPPVPNPPAPPVDHPISVSPFSSQSPSISHSGPAIAPLSPNESGAFSIRQEKPVEEFERLPNIGTLDNQTLADSHKSEQLPISGHASASSEQTAKAASASIEQERIAILRMVAEGRLSPEEGDMLLEAL